MLNRVNCEICGSEIPKERLDILPNTTCCVKCSQTKPYSKEEALGFSEFNEDHRWNSEDFEEQNEYASPEY